MAKLIRVVVLVQVEADEGSGLRTHRDEEGRGQERGG